MSHSEQRQAVPSAWRLLLASGVVLLAACSSSPLRRSETASSPLQLEREAKLGAETRWSLSGRIAVSDGSDGGSGRIEWHQDGERFRIEIRAPVSRRTWRLIGAPGHAVLEGLDGGPRHGRSAETLLQSEVGWVVPIADMVAWIRGARGEGAAELMLDAEGRPAQLTQSGWQVEYRDWIEGDPALPRKVFAARGKQRVRLVVERWDRGITLD